MPKIEFGLMIPADALDKSQRQGYVADANYLIDTVKGAYVLEKVPTFR